MKYYILMILVISLQACVSKKSMTPKIVTGLLPIGSMIRNISGVSYDVSAIIPMEGDHHNLQLTPKKALEIAQADLIIALDPHFDGEFLKTGNKNQPYFLLTEELEQENQDDDNFHNHSSKNSHIWLSFVETIKLYDHIEVILSESFPEDKELFVKNKQHFQAKIAQQFIDITNNIENQSIAVIQRHRVLDHLLDELGIELLGTIEEHDGAQPSLKKVRDMISQINNSDKTVLLIDDAFSSSSSALLEISKATGLPIKQFNSMLSLPGQEGIVDVLTNYN